MSWQDDTAQKYTLESILGEGGAGTVYLGTDEEGNSVVIKQFKNSVLDIRSQSWKREIETLKQINHPQIPKYLDYFEDLIGKRRLPHLVMEYIEGENLEVFIQNHRFEFDESADIIKQILRLLSYIHAFQPPLIHRDIKPSNLLRQKDGSLALIDFGIAVDDIHKTVGRTLGVGTLGYQAPEQVSGDPTTRSDLYSVGVIAVELFTRISPKELLTHRGVLQWQSKCYDLPIAWQKWLDKMLSEDPNGRFLSAEEALRSIPEVDMKKEEEIIQKERTRAAVHVPDVEVANDFLKALQAEAKDHRVEEVAEEEKRRQEQLERERLERQRQIEKERQERQRQQEEERRQEEIRRKKAEEERQRQERRDAIAAYKKNLDEEVAVGWDGLVKMFARDELPIQRGLGVFVQQFSSKMSFEYNDETLQVNVVEFELARMFPKVEQKIVDSYLTKMKKRIADRIQSSEIYREEQESIAKLKEEIENKKTHLKQKKQEKEGLKFWEKWFGKENTLDGEISTLQSEIVNRTKGIGKKRKTMEKYSEQQLQPYLFEWDIVEDGYHEKIRKEQEYLQQLMKSDIYVSYESGDFYVMKTQVTQLLWKAVTNENPSHFKGDDLPVEQVSWFDCVIFANMLSEKLGLEKVYEIPKELTLGASQDKGLAKKVKVNTSANGYRLPMEAEWEYAAKGGEDYKYAGSDDLNEVGWYDGNSGSKTHGVGQKKSNGYGLYDMSGNVWEWCFDKWSDDSSARVYRGGSWRFNADYCEVSYRNGHFPSSRNNGCGVRLFRSSDS